MKNFLTALSKRRFPYEPLIAVEISRSRLLHNLAEFGKLAPKDAQTGLPQIAPVLKSNAYGHGLLEVAGILEKAAGSGKQAATIPFFVVDSYFEAIALRSAGIRTPLLIIGYARPETMRDSRLKNVAFTVTGIETLEALKGASSGAHIHLKIDTGMGRQGIMPGQIDAAISLIKENPGLVLQGICSHLPDADNSDSAFTRDQIRLWNETVKRFKAGFPALRYWHLSNSDGHRFSGKTDANVSRLGIGLYGLTGGDPFTPKLDLQPVMEMRTILTGVKMIAAGAPVGYGGTYRAPTDMAIATIPVGYFEGIDRRLSSGPANSPRGWILVGPSRTPCPIIGRVSMNITAIDVSGVADAAVGMTAVAISHKPGDPDSVRAIAAACDTTAYEVAVHVPEHLKREVVD